MQNCSDDENGEDCFLPTIMNNNDGSNDGLLLTDQLFPKNTIETSRSNRNPELNDSFLNRNDLVSTIGNKSFSTLEIPISSSDTSFLMDDQHIMENNSIGPSNELMNFISNSHSDNWSVNEIELGPLLETRETSEAFKAKVKLENNTNNNVAFSIPKTTAKAPQTAKTSTLKISIKEEPKEAIQEKSTTMEVNSQSASTSETPLENTSIPQVIVGESPITENLSTECSISKEPTIVEASSIVPVSIDEQQRILKIHGFKNFEVRLGSFEKILEKEMKNRKKGQNFVKNLELKHQKRSERDKENKSSSRRKSQSRLSRSRSKSPASTTSKYQSNSGNNSIACLGSSKSKKKRLLPTTVCLICKEAIETVSLKSAQTPVFCSKACIRRQVQIASQCVKSGEIVVLMDLNGMILNGSKAPTLENLENFLVQYPNFQPVLNTCKLDKNDKKEDENTIKKNETKRIEIQRLINQTLQQRSKAAKIPYSSKKIKDLSVEIEKELFALHKAINLKYRTWCKGFILRMKDDANTFYRKIVGERVSVKKLISMTPQEMVGTVQATNQIHQKPPHSTMMAKPLQQPTEAVILASNPEQNLNNSNKNEFNIEFNTSTANISTAEIVKPADSSETPTNIAGEIDSYSSEVDQAIQDLNAMNDDKNLTNLDSPLKINLVHSNTKNMPSFLSKHTMVKKTPLSAVQAKSAIDDILGDMERNTTGQHNSHLYDVNCDICQKKTKLDFAAKERFERLEAKLDTKKRIESEERKRKMPNFPNLDSATKLAMENNLSDATNPIYKDSSIPERRRSMDDDMDIGGVYSDEEDETHIFDNTASTSFLQNDSNTSKGVEDRSFRKRSMSSERSKSFCARSPTIDPWDRNKTDSSQLAVGGDKAESWRFRSGSSPRATWKRTQDKVIKPLISKDDDIWARKNLCVWKGDIFWKVHYEFTCRLIAISNRAAFKVASELGPSLKIVGRIESHVVWEYIHSLRDSWSKQVIVLCLETPTRDRVLRAAYSQLYERLLRNRYGVVDFEGHPTVKDGYVFALEAGEPLPKDLLPLEGPGLPEGTELMPNILLILICKMDLAEKNRLKKIRDENWRNARAAEKMDRSSSGDRPNSSSLPSYADRLSQERSMVDYDDFDAPPPRRSPLLKTLPTSSPFASKLSNDSGMFSLRQKNDLLNHITGFVEEARFKARKQAWNEESQNINETQKVQQQLRMLNKMEEVNKPPATPNIPVWQQYQQRVQSKTTAERIASTSVSTSSLDVRASSAASSIHVNTLEDVLAAIQRIEKPSEIVIMVGDFISENPGITDEERIILRRAINEKSELERIRRNQLQRQYPQQRMQEDRRNSSTPPSTLPIKRQLAPLREDVPLLENSLSKKPKISIKEELTDPMEVVSAISKQMDENPPTALQNPEEDLFCGNIRNRRNSLNSNNSNDSTTAQQISFGDHLTQENKPVVNESMQTESLQTPSEVQEKIPEKQPTTAMNIGEVLLPPPSAEKSNVEVGEPVAMASIPPLPMGSPPPPPPPSQLPTTSSETTKSTISTTTTSSLSMPFAMPPPEMPQFMFIGAPPPPPVPLPISSLAQTSSTNTSSGSACAFLPPPPPPPSLPLPVAVSSHLSTKHDFYAPPPTSSSLNRRPAAYENYDSPASLTHHQFDSGDRFARIDDAPNRQPQNIYAPDYCGPSQSNVNMFRNARGGLRGHKTDNSSKQFPGSRRGGHGPNLSTRGGSRGASSAISKNSYSRNPPHDFPRLNQRGSPPRRGRGGNDRDSRTITGGNNEPLAPRRRLTPDQFNNNNNNNNNGPPPFGHSDMSTQRFPLFNSPIPRFTPPLKNNVRNDLFGGGNQRRGPRNSGRIRPSMDNFYDDFEVNNLNATQNYTYDFPH